MVRLLLSCIDALTRGAAAIAALLAGMMALHIVVDALARSLGNPFQGTLEFTQYLWMPAVVSLSLGYAMYRGEHIRVDLLTSSAGTRTRQAVEILGMSLSLAVLAVVAWAGVDRANESVRIFELAPGSDWIAIWLGRVLVAVGLVVLVLQVVAQLVRAFRNELPEATNHQLVPGETVGDPLLEQTLHTSKAVETTLHPSKGTLP